MPTIRLFNVASQRLTPRKWSGRIRDGRDQSVEGARSRLHFEKAMKIQDIAPGCAEHLKFLSEFYRAEPRPSVFTSAYRKLLAHRYNLLIPADARVLEIGCGAGDLVESHSRKRQDRH